MSVESALRTAGRLRDCGARLGAGQVAFNALLMAKADATGRLSAWTPSGPVPLRHADNDFEASSTP